MKLDIKENETIEFKESLSQLDKGLKSLTAMLNRSNHGVIYFGVKDDGEVCGVQIGEKTYSNIRQKAFDLIEPKIILNIDKKTLEGKTIVIVSANGDDIPYSFDGRFYIRNVSSDEHVSNALLRLMVESGDPDAIRYKESYIQELTFNSFVEYNIRKGLHASDNKGFYKSKGFYTRDGKYNYLAFLLSDQSNVSIKVAIFEGKDKACFSSLKEFGNKCLIDSMNDVLEFVRLYNKNKIEINGIARTEIDLFNFESFKEAWVNACMHNHWIDMLPPSVFIFDDRIEVFSYGQLPFNLSKEEFFAGTSVPVNKSLKEVFVSLHIAEQTGHGVPIIVEHYGKEAFSFKSGTVTVTIPFAFEPDDVAGRRAKKLAQQRLNANQRKVIEYLKLNPHVTQTQLAEALSIGVGTVKKIVLKLQKLSLLERVGSKKDGYWQVKVY